jgi:peptidoglycan/xylan/chitin deacetylase (PgdA/CDA1 family)
VITLEPGRPLDGGPNRASFWPGTLPLAFIDESTRGFGRMSVIRELPRGPFDAYLRAHYFTARPSVQPRFAMGCGAIFMIQRVMSINASLTARGAVAETDPLLLEEMVALVAAQNLDVVSLAEMRRRLLAGELDRRFVTFTFDGAYRSILTSVLPLFEKRGMPFAVYAGSDFLGTGQTPWWMALEALFHRNQRLSLGIDGQVMEVRCGSLQDRVDSYAPVHQFLSRIDGGKRATLIQKACETYGVDVRGLASREMLSPEELKQLDAHDLVTVGSNAGGLHALSELGLDDARETIATSLDVLEAATGRRPRDLAFPGASVASVTARDVNLARELGLETAVTPIEGALWPEHAHELLVLPRIALDNNPATLVRALMLGGETPALDSAERGKGAA